MYSIIKLCSEAELSEIPEKCICCTCVPLVKKLQESFNAVDHSLTYILNNNNKKNSLKRDIVV